MNAKIRKLLAAASVGLALIVGLAFSASPVQAEYRTAPAYFSILNSPNYGTYNGRSYLLWNSLTSQLPLARPYGVAIPLTPGVQVGTSGQCVSFARAVTLAPPAGANGEYWRRGRQVVGGTVAPGTLIATFSWNGSRWVYSGHAAVFRGYAADGSLLAWSQNWPAGFGCVVAHGITGNGNGGVTDRRSYFVVE